MSATPVIVSMTTFQKVTVTLTPKDANGNVVPLAGVPTVSTDHPELISISSPVVDNGVGPTQIQFTISGIKTNVVGGTAQVNVDATPQGGGAAFTANVVTANVSVDPREPGPATHFDAVVTTPVDQ